MSQTFNTMKPSSVVEAPSVSRYSFGNADEELRKEAEMEMMKSDEDSQDSEIPLTILDNIDEDRMISPEVSARVSKDPLDTTIQSTIDALIPPVSVEKSSKILQPIQLLPSPSPTLEPEPSITIPEIHPYIDPSPSSDPLNILAGMPKSMVQTSSPFPSSIPSVIKREPEETIVHSDLEDRTLKSPERSFTSVVAPEQSLSPSTMTSILRSNQHVNTSLDPISPPAPTGSVLTFDFSDGTPRRPHRNITARFARFGRAFAGSTTSVSVIKPVGTESKSLVDSSTLSKDDLGNDTVGGDSPIPSGVEQGTDRQPVAEQSIDERSADKHFDEAFADEQSNECIEKQLVKDDVDNTVEDNEGGVEGSIEDTIHDTVEGTNDAITDEAEVVVEDTVEDTVENNSENTVEHISNQEELDEEEKDYAIETGPFHSGIFYGNEKIPIEEPNMVFHEVPEEQPHSGIYNDSGEIPLVEESPNDLYAEEQIEHRNDDLYEDPRIALPVEQPHSGIYNDDGEVPLTEQIQDNQMETHDTVETERYTSLIPALPTEPSTMSPQVAEEESLPELPTMIERSPVHPEPTSPVTDLRPSLHNQSISFLENLQRDTGITLPVSVSRFVAQEIPRYTESELRREILDAEHRGKVKGKQLVVTVTVAMEALEKEKNNLEERVKELESQMETVQAVRDRSKGEKD